MTNIPHWNWHGYNPSFTMSQILMEIIGVFCAGLVLAWLYRRAPAAS